MFTCEERDGINRTDGKKLMCFAQKCLIFNFQIRRTMHLNQLIFMSRCKLISNS